jgi:hypothetical protein
LLDESAGLACTAYVDLNPIDVNMYKTPETFVHTSIKKQIQALQNDHSQPTTLIYFVGDPRQDMPKGIAYQLKDYCELMDTTVRCFREDKTGYIDSCHSLIVERLGLAAYQ